MQVQYLGYRLLGLNHLQSLLGRQKVRLSFSSIGSFDRAINAKNKEPHTQEWIEAMNPGEIFWDIGANVGIFSAQALRRGLSVLAVEPEPRNYENLIRTLQLNIDAKRFLALPIGLSDSNEFVFINPTRTSLSGTSEPVIESNQSRMKQETAQPWHQVVPVITGDDVANWVPAEFSKPTHIKIDTDGDELGVLRGLRDTLVEGSVKSLMVEVLRENEVITNDFMHLCGFEPSHAVDDQTRIARDVFFLKSTGANQF